jgi:hypothetical protein
LSTYYDFSITIYDPAFPREDLKPIDSDDLEREIGRIAREEGYSYEGTLPQHWEMKQIERGWVIDGSVNTKNLFPFATADKLALRYPTALIEFCESISFDAYRHTTIWRLRGEQRGTWQEYRDTWDQNPEIAAEEAPMRTIFVRDGAELDPPQHSKQEESLPDDEGVSQIDFRGAWGEIVLPELVIDDDKFLAELEGSDEQLQTDLSAEPSAMTQEDLDDLYALDPATERTVKYWEEQIILNRFEANRAWIMAVHTAQGEGITPNRIVYEAIQSTVQELLDGKDGWLGWTEQEIRHSIDGYMKTMIEENQDKRHKVRLMDWEVEDLLAINLESFEHTHSFLFDPEVIGSSRDWNRLRYYESQAEYLKKMLDPKVVARVEQEAREKYYRQDVYVGDCRRFVFAAHDEKQDELPTELRSQGYFVGSKEDIEAIATLKPAQYWVGDGRQFTEVLWEFAPEEITEGEDAGKWMVRHTWGPNQRVLKELDETAALLRQQMEGPDA